jgi:hypothetical protein
MRYSEYIFSPLQKRIMIQNEAVGVPEALRTRPDFRSGRGRKTTAEKGYGEVS